MQDQKNRRSGHASGLACIQDLNGQLHHGTLLEQPPHMQPAEPAGIEPLGILWGESSYRECPTSASGGCIPKGTAIVQEDQLF